jgi:hypothetical protein
LKNTTEAKLKKSIKFWKIEGIKHLFGKHEIIQVIEVKKPGGFVNLRRVIVNKKSEFPPGLNIL